MDSGAVNRYMQLTARGNTPISAASSSTAFLPIPTTRRTSSTAAQSISRRWMCREKAVGISPRAVSRKFRKKLRYASAIPAGRERRLKAMLSAA